MPRNRAAVSPAPAVLCPSQAHPYPNPLHQHPAALSPSQAHPYPSQAAVPRNRAAVSPAPAVLSPSQAHPYPSQTAQHPHPAVLSPSQAHPYPNPLHQHPAVLSPSQARQCPSQAVVPRNRAAVSPARALTQTPKCTEMGKLHHLPSVLPGRFSQSRIFAHFGARRHRHCAAPTNPTCRAHQPDRRLLRSTKNRQISLSH